jgi:hypothetical protein
MDPSSCVVASARSADNEGSLVRRKRIQQLLSRNPLTISVATTLVTTDYYSSPARNQN